MNIKKISDVLDAVVADSLKPHHSKVSKWAAITKQSAECIHKSYHRLLQKAGPSESKREMGFNFLALVGNQSGREWIDTPTTRLGGPVSILPLHPKREQGPREPYYKRKPRKPISTFSCLSQGQSQEKTR
jgi:hypothetical protein